MSIKYELIIYWSDDDQSFVVEVPELPGCMADGQTYEQAVKNAQQIIEEWVETARELAIRKIANGRINHDDISGVSAPVFNTRRFRRRFSSYAMVTGSIG